MNIHFIAIALASVANAVAELRDVSRVTGAASISASQAPKYIPNFPQLGPAQGNQEVIYYPQNPATANSFNMATMLCLVNRLRMSHGLQPVVYLQSLLKLATQHAAFQARYRVITHADSSGQIGDRLTALGIDCSLFLENVGAGTDSEKAIMDAWAMSPGHLANILNPDIRFMGVRVANGFWVQDFAVPRDPRNVPAPNTVNACPSADNLYIYA